MLSFLSIIFDSATKFQMAEKSLKINRNEKQPKKKLKQKHGQQNFKFPVWTKRI